MASMVMAEPAGWDTSPNPHEEESGEVLGGGALRSEAVVRRVGSAIALGLLGDGEQLPAETELATMLNVSTVTLREALADLRELGLVETRRGRGGGSFVRARDDALAELAGSRLTDLGTTDLRELGDLH